MDQATVNLDENKEIVCTECGLPKPPEAFHLVRGPLTVGTWRAQPCADCCRRRVEQGWAGLTAGGKDDVGRHTD
jgi:hypothetical protein